MRILPDGQITQNLSSPARENIPVIAQTNQDYLPTVPSLQKGRCATSSTRGGMRWTWLVPVDVWH
jgi:hypothetical protein